ncbi:MAG: tRNA adenosine(34) deaminase TadA [Pseudobdellovibrio sp.]
MTLNDIKQQDHFSEIDKKFMKRALKIAKLAETKGEIPIGAVLVDKNDQIISQAHNIRELQNSVIGHAEIVALHKAGQKQQSWRLTDCTLYVTLEPCFMCAGALVQSRIKRVVFAAHDPKGGALGSLANLAEDKRLNHRFSVQSGLFAEESSQLLKKFFKMKRQKK